MGIKGRQHRKYFLRQINLRNLRCGRSFLLKSGFLKLLWLTLFHCFTKFKSFCCVYTFCCSRGHLTTHTDGMTPRLGSQSNCLIIKGIVGKQVRIRWYVGFLNFRTYKLLQKFVQKTPYMFQGNQTSATLATLIGNVWKGLLWRGGHYGEIGE